MNYWNWDVKDTLRLGQYMRDTKSTRSINLMAYLLHNIPYSTLYDDHLENVVRRLLINLDRFPRSLKVAADGTTPYDVDVHLAEALYGIDALILPGTRPSGIKLRYYFEHTGDPDPVGTPEREIADILDGLPDELSHFCTPFLPFYYNNQEYLSPARMNQHLTHLGAFTLFDIYTLGNIQDKYDTQKEEVIAARNDKILKFTTRTEPGLVLLNVDPKNGLKCSSNGTACEDGEEDDWCNLDQNGNCTIGS